MRVLDRGGCSFLWDNVADNDVSGEHHFCGGCGGAVSCRLHSPMHWRKKGRASSRFLGCSLLEQKTIRGRTNKKFHKKDQPLLALLSYVQLLVPTTSAQESSRRLLGRAQRQVGISGFIAILKQSLCPWSNWSDFTLWG